jgi:hypothetical protein
VSYSSARRRWSFLFAELRLDGADPLAKSFQLR